jgi:hypothetical protein
MLRAWLCLAVAITCAACPHDVRVHYPSDPAEPTGTVILAFSKPASDVIVAVNGHLVVDGEDTEKVVIDGIPTGTVDLAIASGPGEKQMQVWVSEDNPLTIPLGYPGSSTGDTVKGILSSLVGVLVYALILR